MIPKNLKLATLLLTNLLLSACSPNLSPNQYSADSVGVTARVVAGSIESIREVQINKNSGVGGVAGTGAGAIAGASAASHNATTAALGAIGGAVVGGVVGDKIESAMHKQKGYEFIIRTHEGKLISITQPSDITFGTGDNVLVIFGNTTRVIHDRRAHYAKNHDKA